jgi:hypothetical protein
LFDDNDSRRRHRREVVDVADGDAHDDDGRTTTGKQFLQDDVTGGRENASEEAWRLDNAMATNEVAAVETFIVIVNIIINFQLLHHRRSVRPSHRHRHCGREWREEMCGSTWTDAGRHA